MKTKIMWMGLALLALSTLNPQLSAAPLGRDFTYQGRLNNGSSPANGSYDLMFTLYDSASGPTVVNLPLTNSATAVSNGLFTVTLDFGPGAFTGDARWLEVAVRATGSPGDFVTLNPRQPLTATPYARYASSAGSATLAYSVSDGSISSASLAAGAVGAAQLASNAVNTAALADGSIQGVDVNASSFSNVFWKVDGNSGTTPGVNFLGTTDNQPLELRANNATALKLTPSQWGASVSAGGGGATASGVTAISMGYATTASGAASVALGDRTTASGWESVALGELTTASGDYATAMGYYTKATNVCSTAIGSNTVAGGFGSTAMGRSTKALGSSSVAMGLWSTASGANSLAAGYSCTAAGSSSVALGYYAYADHGYSFVWNDGSSGVSGDIHTTGENQFVIGASGGVGIGAAPGDAMLDIQGNVRVNKHDLYFREGTDRSHGLGWYGAGKLFGTTSPDGPVLYGYSGGGLGSISGGSQLSLQWFANGNVTVRGTLSQGSDRNIKTNFSPANPAAVLEKVVALPVQTWRYKTEADGTRHLGPVSQDFYASFGLGDDDRHITTVDESGVALAAIQGLNQKLEEQRGELEQKETEIAELKTRLERLEQLCNARSGGER